MGDVPWGTHSCQFYRYKKDLTETLAPYMKAGLDNNELCVLITANPLDTKKAGAATALPGLRTAVRDGRLKIIPHEEWYLDNGSFNPSKACGRWKELHRAAVSKGFDGVRAAGIMSWLERKDWKAFADYEKDLFLSLGGLKMICVCAYPLARLAAAEVIEVVSNHWFSLLRHEGAWAVVESPDRRKAEEKILESERRYRGLYESIRDGIIRMDVGGRIVDCNDAFLGMLGYAMDEIRNMTFLDLTPRRWHELNKTIIREQLMTRGYSDEYEKEYARRDGSIIPVSNRTWLIRDDDGRPAGMWSIVRDITPQKMAEEQITWLHIELNSQIKKLEEANAELEAFNFTLAHDLSSPLRVIDGFSKMIEKYYRDVLDEEGRDFIKTIRSSAQKMGMFISDLLKLSRLSRSEITITEIDMSGLAAALSAELNAASEKTIEFRIAALPAARGQETLIRQALFNLMSNAVKFSAPRERPMVEIGCLGTDGENVYYVRDNGVGFDMRHADRLFGVFKRLHSESEFEGTGAGLAIVKRVVQRHGGRVWGEGKVGQGATFYFTLPR